MKKKKKERETYTNVVLKIFVMTLMYFTAEQIYEFVKVIDWTKLTSSNDP